MDPIGVEHFSDVTGGTRDVPPPPAAALRHVLLARLPHLFDEPSVARIIVHIVQHLDDAAIAALGDRLLSAPVTADDIATLLDDLQRESVRRQLTPGRATVALYFPLSTYREHIAGLADPLRRAGYTVIVVLGVVCGDAFEQREAVYFGGSIGTRMLLESWDFVDLTVSPVLATELPPRARRVYVLHDIHDSPLGDRAAVQEIADNLQAYDYVYAPGPATVEVFRRVIPQAASPSGARRPVTIVPGGYMKLDRFIGDFVTHAVDARSIVYAPTVTGYGLDEVGTVAVSGRDIIATLLDAAPDHEIVFRPHPNSLRTAEVRRIVDEFSTQPRVTLDDNAASYVAAYARARLMVSDISGTAFTYALATLRPVVFCSFNEAEVTRRYGQLRYVRDRHRIGVVVHDLAELGDVVRRIVAGIAQRDAAHEQTIAAYRNEALFNVGRAHDYFVEHVDDFIHGRSQPDWITVA